jgi:integrase
MGGIRALDLDHYDADARTLEFEHQPKTGTPLKNKTEGERLVGISEDVADALDVYIARERGDARDEHGRDPLFATAQGRASFPTLRAYSYLGTQPCLHVECPHGRRRSGCEYTERSHASKCPSSRSPHQVRTGSITWQLNQGLGIELVAKRVNSTPATIRRYYDVAGKHEEFEQRRREAERLLDIDTEDFETNA